MSYLKFGISWQTATPPASETEMEGGRNEGEASTVAAAEGDATMVDSESPDEEHQKHNSDTDGGLEAGQIEGDNEEADNTEEGDVDLDVLSWLIQ